MNRPFHVTAELASAYLDRELPQPERRRLDLHFETCADCRLRLDRLRGTVDLLARVRRSVPPADLARRVHWDVRAEAARPVARTSFAVRLMSSWGGLMTLATAAVMLLGVGLARDLSWERERALSLRPSREVVSVVSYQGLLNQPRTTSEVAGRTFVWNDDNLWVEQGIRERAPHRMVLASSPAGRYLLARYSDLGYLIEGGERVLLRDRRDTLELWNGS